MRYQQGKNCRDDISAGRPGQDRAKVFDTCQIVALPADLNLFKEMYIDKYVLKINYEEMKLIIQQGDREDEPEIRLLSSEQYYRPEN